MRRPFSGKQLNMLQAFYDNGLAGRVTIEEAMGLLQPTLRSMMIRDYVAYRPNGARGFHITKTGVEAMEDFHAANILRKNPTLPLTSYFDPAAYGLTMPKQKGARKARGPAPGNVREFINQAL